MRLLLVEDERSLAESLAQILKQNKYTVDVAFDGESGLDSALTGLYDLIILDIMLPKKSGLTVLRELRENKISTPVLLLTARGEISDKVKGLDSGADDYLPKPFYTEELLARIRALTRRKNEIIPDNRLTFADLALNLSTYELAGPESSVMLTLKEFELIRHFLSLPNCVIGKDDLISRVWGYDAEVEHNNLEVYISFLRKKMVFIGSRSHLRTLRGIGYKLEEAIDV